MFQCFDIFHAIYSEPHAQLVSVHQFHVDLKHQSSNTAVPQIVFLQIYDLFNSESKPCNLKLSVQ